MKIALFRQRRLLQQQGPHQLAGLLSAAAAVASMAAR
jgi:hypothetical protein